MKRSGFTLIELMIACVIIGILASIAVPRFVRVVEKGRTAEARNALGVLRDAELAYFMEHNFFTPAIADLNVPLPVACNASYHFSYSVAVAGANFVATAARCAANGRPPQTAIPYSMTLNRAGSLGCTEPTML